MSVAQEVIAAFQAEHKDQLRGIRAFLEAVGTAQDADARARLDEAFRLAHSLKGGARVCDLGEIETIGHLMESLLARVREGVVELDQQATAALQQALDAVEDWMAELGADRKPSTVTRVDESIARLSAFGGERPRMPAAPVRSEPPDETPSVAPAPPSPRPAATTDAQSLRVRADVLDRVLRLSDELTVECGRLTHQGTRLKTLGSSVAALLQECSRTRKRISASLQAMDASPEFIRMQAHFGQLDQQIRGMARELAQIRSEQARTSWTLRSTCDRLQHQVRDVRMVTAESVFQGFRKMVRDVAREEGKEIEFQAVGTEVLADKVVLERLKDPVMHMLRNAVAHGIETPDVRRRKGKDPVGQIALRLRSVGQRLTLQVEDDGAGIDRDKVTAAARAGGWMTGDAAALGNTALERVLFQPGFSTRADVNRVAGRGVGLSVVQQAVSQLQGVVRFVPRDGAGTTLQIEVPLAVCTHRVLLVACGDAHYCIPVHAVERLVRVDARQLERVEGKPALRTEDASLPLSGLREMLGRGESETVVASGSAHILVLRSTHQRRAVVVDRFCDERPVVVQPIGGPIGRQPIYSGAVLLDDGNVALVINPAALSTHDVSPVRIDAETPETVVHEVGPATILVADDSFTTRTLERSILETRGYRVRLAVDGVDALAQLRADPVDLVVSDVQMPRMDGFQLVEEIKKDPHLKKLPIVLVTSMDQREYRERGLAIGADAYVVKQRFDHEALLAVIEQLVGPVRSVGA